MVMQMDSPLVAAYLDPLPTHPSNFMKPFGGGANSSYQKMGDEFIKNYFKTYQSCMLIDF